MINFNQWRVRILDSERRLNINSVESTKSEEAGSGGQGKNFRKEREGGMITFIWSLITHVIFNMRDVAISPKYNFEKLPGKLAIWDFY